MTCKTTNEWLKVAPMFSPQCDIGPRRRAVCKSGLSLSIQASRWHYCSPKQDNASSYTTVEVGFPERDGKPVRLRSLGPAESRRSAVWAYVPVEALDRLLKRNGGIVGASYE